MPVICSQSSGKHRVYSANNNLVIVDLNVLKTLPDGRALWSVTRGRLVASYLVLVQDVSRFLFTHTPRPIH